jgi:hypothetical protein
MPAFRSSVRLCKRADAALKLSFDTHYATRVKGLEEIGDYSFALLIHWTRIEALLKALRYQRNINEDFPNDLNSIVDRRWPILNQIFKNDEKKYSAILGETKKDPKCLWKIRNEIVHSNYVISASDYERFRPVAVWFFKELFSNLDKSYDITRKNFMDHKRKNLTK